MLRDARWYLHFGLIVSLYKARTCLQLFKSKVEASNSVVSNSKLVAVLDTIGSSMFWMNLSLVVDLLSPLTIEIGIDENQNANISDVQYFGRFYALLEHKKLQKGHRYVIMPSFIEDLLVRLERWFNCYSDVDLLLLEHIFHASHPFYSLRRDKITGTVTFNSLK